PFVDAARGLHEQSAGGNADGGLGGNVVERGFAEREVSFGPSHHLKDDLFDLCAHLPVELAPRDGAEVNQNVAEAALVARGLHVPRAGQVALRQLAGPEEETAQLVRIALDLGGDD